ncbi:C2H2-type domain-containing protein [Trichostrongylus colubriformis]|uniref:C2H2-type domain-containing protein n=1 Tax=Trichostrongylus colubriformis TaxID=6319 RepID=A0AAN8F813_TRICO
MKDALSQQAERPSEKDAVECPLCEERFRNQELLARHCGDEHEEDGAEGEPQDYTVFTLTFETKQEFDVWLEERQQQGRTSFFTKNSSGSKKTTQLRGCLGHVGHKVDVALLRLTLAQQLFLKGLLEEFSQDYIISRLRKDYPGTISRLHFVTKGDLWNIVNRFGLRPGFRHKDDMQSLKARKEEGNPDDGIRSLDMPEDPSGEGFRMIIITPQQVQWLRKFSHRGISIDDTHNATRYNLKLATVMVLNDRDAGLPAAFLLSGTMTSLDVEKLFLEIRKVVPEFNPAQIVTDEAPCFYNGFRSVFPQSRAKLHYCRWHIDKAWQRNVNKLVEPRLRSQVKKKLKELLVIEDLPIFERHFAEILAFLHVEGQDKMDDYLRRNYLGETHTWASFSNKDAVMDTTMISERWHLRLKTEFLHRNANTRADCLVDLLIRAVEDLAESDEIKVRRRLATASYRVQQTTMCHRLAAKHYDRRLDSIRRAANAESVEGNVHCPICDVCPYAWSCSCMDNRTGISCVHRHAVMLHSKPSNIAAMSQPQGYEETAITGEQGSSVTQISTDVSAAQERKEQRNLLRNSISAKVSVLQTNVNVLVNTDTEQAREMLTAIHELVDAASKIRVTPATGIATRPELYKVGGKPKLSKVELHTRKQSRVAKDSSREGAGNGDG